MSIEAAYSLAKTIQHLENLYFASCMHHPSPRSATSNERLCPLQVSRLWGREIVADQARYSLQALRACFEALPHFAEQTVRDKGIGFKYSCLAFQDCSKSQALCRSVTPKMESASSFLRTESKRLGANPDSCYGFQQSPHFLPGRPAGRSKPILEPAYVIYLPCFILTQLKQDRQSVVRPRSAVPPTAREFRGYFKFE